MHTSAHTHTYSDGRMCKERAHICTALHILSYTRRNSCISAHIFPHTVHTDPVSVCPGASCSHRYTTLSPLRAHRTALHLFPPPRTQSWVLPEVHGPYRPVASFLGSQRDKAGPVRSAHAPCTHM